MTEKKSRNGQTDSTNAMGEILQTLGEAILAGKDLTIEHWQALYLACKRGATVCRRAVRVRKEAIRANKEEEKA